MTTEKPAEPSAAKPSPYVTVTPSSATPIGVFAKKSPPSQSQSHQEQPVYEMNPGFSTAPVSSQKPLSEDDEDDDDEDSMDTENFQGLNDAQLIQLSKKGIAKWYEQKIQDMAKGVTKLRKSSVPKTEVEELKRDRAKAVAYEQQKFRQEITTKNSLIDSLKKKLKSLQEKKEKEVVAYAQCAEKLSQRVKALTADLSKAKAEKATTDQSSAANNVYKEENAKLQQKVEEQKKMLEKVGHLQTQNAQLQEQVSI